MKVTKNIDIYLIGKRPVKPIDVVQYDTGIQLVFTVKDFPIPSDATATLYVQKPSGKFVYQEENITVASNAITVDLENQALTEHGRTPYQVTVTSGSDTITTFTGLMIVERSLKDAGAVESRTVIKAFDEVTASKIAEFQASARAIADAVIGTIPDDYTELSAKVNESANAIKGHLSGAVVSADDVSPVEHLIKVNVHGKNLLPNNILDVSTWQLATGTTNNHLYPLTFLKDGQTYTISGIKKDVSDGYFYIEKSNDGFATNSDIHLITPNNFFMPVTFAKEAGWDYRFFWYGQGVMLSDCVENLQLECGDTATEYTPYVDPSTVTVRRCGKNLIDISAMCNDFLVENADGSCSFTMGEIAGERFSKRVPLYIPAGIPFYFSTNFVAHTVKNETLYMILTHADGTESYPGITFEEEKREITFNKAVTNIRFYLQASEVAGAYITFKNFQIEKGNEATDYEPYNGTEHIPTSDGVVSGLASVSPNMTILTDTEGVIVECEYNKDTNKVVQKLADALGITI